MLALAKLNCWNPVTRPNVQIESASRPLQARLRGPNGQPPQTSVTEHLINLLACPVDLSPLLLSKGTLVCQKGHEYPIVDDIPVLLIREDPPNHGAFKATWERLSSPQRANTDPIKTAGGAEIDPYVQGAIVHTCGLLYTNLLGRLARYPIPDIPFDQAGSEDILLDIGCNWGRWSVSAARLGYKVIGIDPSIESLLAARRVASQLGVEAAFLVADARRLPLRSNMITRVWSYSVLQHFAKDDARKAIAEVGRVLKPSGTVKIQMPNRLGLRNLYHQIRRGFRSPTNFEVRYWGISELEAAFSATIGPSITTVDGFFSLNPQKSDLDLLPWHYRLVVELSDLLRRAGSRVPAIKQFADSVFVESRGILLPATPARSLAPSDRS